MKKFLERRVRRAGIEFLVGWKCLTEKGKGRIDKFCKVLRKLATKEVELNYIGYIDDIVMGLEMFKSGTEGGFVDFEKLDTLNKIRVLIESGGNVGVAYDRYNGNREL